MDTTIRSSPRDARNSPDVRTPFVIMDVKSAPEAGIGQPYSRYLLVRPQDLNHAGTLFGGAMMAFADEMAFIAATLTFPGCSFVTKVFHEFNFISGPVEGEIVKIEAQVLKKGRTSVTVGVRASNAVTHRDIFQTEAVLVNAQHGKSIPIPDSATSGILT